MPSPDSLELSIVLPAYEEADNLENLIPEMQKVAASLASTYEILIVDTETPHDRTPDVCHQYGVTYLPREGGSNYGHAVSTGIAASKGQYVVLMDADGSHSPQFISQLWPYREANDLVIASRYTRGGKTENPWILILLSHAVNVIFRLVLGLKCLDVSNSFRLYQGGDLRKHRYICLHFDIVEEILVTLAYSQPGYRIKEIPFTFEKRKAGKTKRQLLIFAVGYLGTLARLLALKRKVAAAVS